MDTNTEDDGVKVPQGQRNQYLADVAFWYSSVNGDDLLQLLMRTNQEKCVPSLSESEVTRIVKWVNLVRLKQK